MKNKNRLLTLLFLLCFIAAKAQKTYIKNYYDNGKLSSEGWVNQNKKTDYWFFYHKNGNKKEEGHYFNDKKTKWWIVYDVNGKIQRKIEFNNNLENGLSIFYHEGKIYKAARYNAGSKIKEWTSIASYKKDNP
jgi:antitoxin component YwqK of YwqJK toxin-antitoxin module